MFSFNVRKVIFFIAFVVLLIAGQYADAQTTPTTPISTTQKDVNFKQGLETDVSVGVLQGILGDWKSPTLDPEVGGLFQLLNLGVLVFGAVLFMYFSIMGTVHSAEDGEVLGKRWGSVFVPIRVASGMALLFPMSNGFSGIQILVLWLATNGIGFANWVTVNTVEGFVKSQGSVIAGQMIDRENLNATMQAILQAEVCVAELNETLRSDEYNPDRNAFGGPYISQGTGLNTWARVEWGKQSSLIELPGEAIADAILDRECGSITMPNLNGVDGSGVIADGTSALYGMASGAFKGFDAKFANMQLRAAHFRAIQNASMKMRPLAQAFVSTDPNILKPTPNQLAESAARAGFDYKNEIALAMNVEGVIPSTKSITDPMVEGVKKFGWANLGTFFYQYARVNTELSKMTSYTPEIQFARHVKSQTTAATDSLKRVLEKGTPNKATVDAINDAGRAEGGIVGGAVGLTNQATNAATRYGGEIFGVDPNNKINAIIQLKNVGDNILTAAEVLFVAAAVAEVVTDVTPAGKIASTVSTGFFKKIIGRFSGDAVGVAKYVGLFAIFSLLTFGMILAFWMPMTPFILWLGGVCGWIISVIEMVVAGPLWAAAHLHPEGEGMASKYGANGYMIVMEVFAKPVLMVIGFFIAARFSDVFLRFSSGLFFNNMATVNGDSISGIVTALAFFFMYVSFCVALINRSFSLIHIIPSSVLRWVGANLHDNFTQTSDISQNLESNMKGTMNHAMTPLHQGGAMAAAKRALTKERTDKSDIDGLLEAKKKGST